MDFSTIKIASKKASRKPWIFRLEKLHGKSGNNLGFSTIEINRKKYVETTWIFRPENYTEESTWSGNNVDFLASEITPKKVRGNSVDVLTIKIISKKSTWK